MNVAQAQTPASTAAPTLTEATCVAVLEVSSELDRGEELHRHQISEPCLVFDVMIIKIIFSFCLLTVTVFQAQASQANSLMVMRMTVCLLKLAMSARSMEEESLDDTGAVLMKMN